MSSDVIIIKSGGVNATCRAANARPAAELEWLVNGQSDMSSRSTSSDTTNTNGTFETLSYMTFQPDATVPKGNISCVTRGHYGNPITSVLRYEVKQTQRTDGVFLFNTLILVDWPNVLNNFDIHHSNVFIRVNILVLGEGGGGWTEYELVFTGTNTAILTKRKTP